MAGASFFTTMTEFIETHLVRKDFVKATKRENATLAFIPQDQSADGSGYEEPIILSDPNTVAATRAQVQFLQEQAAGSLMGKRWLVPWAELKSGIKVDYKTWLIGKESYDRGNGVSSVFLDALKDNIKGAAQSWGRNINDMLCGGSSMLKAVGTISSGVITLASKEDVWKFQHNEVLQAADGEAVGSVLLGAGSVGHIFKIDPDAGTISVATTSGSTTAATPSGWGSSTVYLYKYGLFGAGATPATGLVTISQWIPTTTPTTTLAGIDRSIMPWILGGVRTRTAQNTNASRVLRIQRLMANMKTYGLPKMGDRMGFCCPAQVQCICEELEQKRISTNMETDATYGIETISIVSPFGRIKIAAEPGYADTEFRILDNGSMKLKTFSSFPHVISPDGQTVRVQGNTDDIEYRTGGLGGFIVRAPGANGYCTLPSST